MSRRAAPPYPSSPNWVEWATSLVEYLNNRDLSQAESLPATILLRHKIGDTISKPTTDGILMFDPASGRPVVSVSNAWVPLELNTGSTITQFTGLSDTPDTYVGNAGRMLRVNSQETGLEYVAFDPATALTTTAAAGLYLRKDIPDTAKGPLTVGNNAPNHVRLAGSGDKALSFLNGAGDVVSQVFGSGGDVHLNTVGGGLSIASSGTASFTKGTQLAGIVPDPAGDIAERVFLTQYLGDARYLRSADMSAYLTTEEAASNFLSIEVAGLTYLPLSGGTVTGNLTVQGNLNTVGNWYVYLGSTDGIKGITRIVDESNNNRGQLAVEPGSGAIATIWTYQATIEEVRYNQPIVTNSDVTVGGTLGVSGQTTMDGTLVVTSNNGSAANNALRVPRTGAMTFHRNSSAAGSYCARFYSDYSASDTMVFEVASDGDLTNINNSYGAISDARAKENIVDLPDQLDDLMRLRTVHYNMIGGTKTLAGLVAQEVQQVKPGLVSENDEGVLGLKYSVLIPLMLKGMQELNAKVEALT